jgi:alkylhydroperoxidase/carboxymuconolactone decarboxylase family protein YurZ
LDAREHERSAEELGAEIARGRGDSFGEVDTLLRISPRTAELIYRCAGYVHGYEGERGDDQVLSDQMRELIATCQLSAMRDHRFAPNHVRRLYRMGVTNAVIVEAAEGIAPAVGWSTVLRVCGVIDTANDPSYPDGELPPEGPPCALVPFPELELGRTLVSGAKSSSLSDFPSWRSVADIDPELVARTSAFVDHCTGHDRTTGESYLGPGVRALVTVAALCVRGETGQAAAFMKRALDYGMTVRQLVEAVSCVIPMTGAATMDACMRALGQVPR